MDSYRDTITLTFLLKAFAQMPVEKACVHDLLEAIRWSNLESELNRLNSY